MFAKNNQLKSDATARVSHSSHHLSSIEQQTVVE